MRKLLPPVRRPSRAALGLSVAAAILTLGLFMSTASATVMKYVGLEQLIHISDIIVQAKVVDQHTYFDKAQKRIVTDTTFSVERSFWGGVKDKVTIQQWGGTYKGRTLIIPGDAHFSKGEEAIVFLSKSPSGLVTLSAMSQSKFKLVKTGSNTLVSRDLSDVAFMIAGKDGKQKVTHLPGETRSYASFVAELQSLVEGIKGGTNE